jgi:hypothetical protein
MQWKENIPIRIASRLKDAGPTKPESSCEKAETHVDGKLSEVLSHATVKPLQLRPTHQLEPKMLCMIP